MLKGGLMKMKLRNWVKVVLVIIGAWLLINFWNGFCRWNNEQIQSCVEGGHTEYWCKRELNK